MEDVDFLFRVEHLTHEIRSFWPDQGFRTTLLMENRVHCGLEASHTELLRDFLNLCMEEKIKVQISEYDKRCDKLFFILSDFEG